MSKTTKNTSTGKPGDSKVKRDVNRFNLLDDNSDNSDSDKDMTAKIVKPVKKINKKSGANAEELKTDKNNSDINDGFQTVTNPTKNKKSAKKELFEEYLETKAESKFDYQAIMDEIEKPKSRKNTEPSNTQENNKEKVKETVKEVKEVVKEFVKEVVKEEVKEAVKEAVKEEVKEEVKDVVKEEVKEVKEDKITRYVPPVSNHQSDDGWAQQQRRKRNEYEEQDDKNRISYYNPEVKLNGDDMKLNTEWTVWIHENDNPDWSLSSYRNIFKINSIGSMWRFLWVLDNLNKNVRQYYIMRNGITPIWEDNNNRTGAICSIMIDNMNRGSRQPRCDLGVDAFSAICILVMNESFVKENQDINGLCYSIKSRSALIKLWIKDHERNSDFITKLPITFLKSIDAILSRMESKNNYNGHGNRHNNNYNNNIRSKVSVQIKPIKPTD